jgi:predicted MFS family arabinose efflux permease
MYEMTAEWNGRSRWATLALLFVARVGLGFQFQTIGSVADPLVSELHLSFAEIGTLIGLYMMPGLVLAIPAGFAGRHASDRTLVSASLLFLALGGACAALAHGFGLLAMGRLLCGVGFVLSTIYFAKMVADWFAGRELATAMAVLVMSWPFGIAMGQIGHGWLAAQQGWRAPFAVATVYRLAAALTVLLGYRAPPRTTGAAVSSSSRLTAREWTLTAIAAIVWAAFNAAYVVYLSFAPKVLMTAADGNLSALQAASIVSLASWVMILSGAACGQLADRSGRHDLILNLCLICAMAVLALLPQVAWAVPLSLAFGLVGMAPAGLIMALTARSMAADKRAFGMGVFFSVYFLVQAPAPGIAGWLYDRTGEPMAAILFAIGLFAVTLAAGFAFRAAERAFAAPRVQTGAG